MPFFSDAELVAFTGLVLRTGGLAVEQAPVVADLLVAGDRLGHDTHGLALLPRYFAALERGQMKAAGEPEVVSDRGSAVVWDGQYLCGVWLVQQALELASARAREHGLAGVAIRRAHHTACLQAFLPPIVARGQVPMVMLTDPSNASVAPFGGVESVFSSDPIAVGLPAGDRPVLVDMSSAIATNAMVGRAVKSGARLAGPWLQNAMGELTDDPAVAKEAGGSLLPVGGLDHGQKGTSLALIVEGLAQGLPGYGRLDGERNWGASVYIQVIDPAWFAGTDAFAAQTSHVAELVRNSRPRPGGPAVRVPGDGALARAQQAERTGVPLSDAIVSDLALLADRIGVPLPVARTG